MTEQTTYTAGPWIQDCFLVAGADRSWVCHTGMGNPPPSRSHESEANARLIAAAPDLLAALKRIRLLAFGTYSAEDEALNAFLEGYDKEVLLAVDAAIAKATGSDQ